MKYTTLGSTGTTVSRLCYVTWRFGTQHDETVETDREEVHALLDACHEHGINFSDDQFDRIDAARRGDE